jgi:hypothetical protein
LQLTIEREEEFLAREAIRIDAEREWLQGIVSAGRRADQCSYEKDGIAPSFHTVVVLRCTGRISLFSLYRHVGEVCVCNPAGEGRGFPLLPHVP